MISFILGVTCTPPTCRPPESQYNNDKTIIICLNNHTITVDKLIDNIMELEIKTSFAGIIAPLPQEAHVGNYVAQRSIPLAEPHHLPVLVALLVLVQGNQQLHHLLPRRFAVVRRVFVAAKDSNQASISLC